MSGKKNVAEKKVLTEAEKEANKAAKAKKFVEIGRKRTNNIIKGIRNLGKLASSNYVYTPEQAEKMTKAIETALAETKAKFSGTKTAASEFDF